MDAVTVRTVLVDFGETLVEWVSDEVVPLVDQEVTAFPDAGPCLERLRDAGLRIAVVSNTTQSSAEDMRVVLRRLDLDGLVDLVVTSFDVGVQKPDRRIFEVALRRLGGTAEEAAMIGNDLTADVLGAAAMGMVTVLLARHPAPDVESGAAPTFLVRTLLEVPDLLVVAGEDQASSTARKPPT